MAATSNGRLESERIRDTLAQDERWFEELRMLVLDRSPAPRERLDRIVKLLESLCRIGDGTPENMLGSALSIPLQEDRRQDVLLHVTGFFREMREDVSQWYRPNGDQVRRVRFNDVANLASNQ
ncbi:MAG TPA: hypothetical protein PK765_07740 [bacterium]|nr:hypothetical protein [bacterium]